MTPSDLIFHLFLQIDTAMALTSLSNVYLSNDVNKFFNLSGRVTVNATLLFLENSYTSSVVVKRDVQKKLIEVIQARNNNIGNGNLYAQSRLNPKQLQAQCTYYHFCKHLIDNLTQIKSIFDSRSR